MSVYVTGPYTEDLEALSASLSMSGIDGHVLLPDMSTQNIYDEILASEAVLLVFTGTQEELIELSTELGFAISLGKPVYAVREHPRNNSRFLTMPGVRIFQNTDQALDAISADLSLDEETFEDEVHGLGTGPDEDVFL